MSEQLKTDEHIRQARKGYYRLWCGRCEWFMRLFTQRFAYYTGRLPKEGGVLLVPNHNTLLDIPVHGASTDRMLCFMARDSLAKIPFLGKWMIAVGSFLVKRGSADRAALRKACELLADGYVVVIFAEGTRNHPSRQIAPLNDGVAVIARMAKVPIVPAVTVYKWVFGWPFLKVIVIYGKPILPEKQARDRGELMEQIRSGMVETLDEAIAIIDS